MICPNCGRHVVSSVSHTCTPRDPADVGHVAVVAGLAIDCELGGVRMVGTPASGGWLNGVGIALTPEVARELGRALFIAADLCQPNRAKEEPAGPKSRERRLTKAARTIDSVIVELDRNYRTCDCCQQTVYARPAQSRMALELGALVRKLDRFAHSRYLGDETVPK